MDSDTTESRPKPGRFRQLFLNIAPFLALGAFKIWSSLGQTGGVLLPAALAMLALCIFILFIASRWDRPNYFDWAVTFFFAAVSAFLLIAPQMAGEFLFRYPVTGIYAVLFAAAFFPPLLGMDPFTYAYAKKRAPREFWDHPLFIGINRIMSLVWSAVFLFSILLSLYPSLITRALIPLTIFVVFGIPFNRRFPRYYLIKKGVPAEALARLKQPS